MLIGLLRQWVVKHNRNINDIPSWIFASTAPIADSEHAPPDASSVLVPPVRHVPDRVAAGSSGQGVVEEGVSLDKLDDLSVFLRWSAAWVS